MPAGCAMRPFERFGRRVLGPRKWAILQAARILINSTNYFDANQSPAIFNGVSFRTEPSGDWPMIYFYQLILNLVKAASCGTGWTAIQPFDA